MHLSLIVVYLRGKESSMTMKPIEEKELREFLDKQFEGCGVDGETKEVFVDTFIEFDNHRNDALRYIAQSWPDRDSLPSGDPIGDIEEPKEDPMETFKRDDKAYLEAIKSAGKHIDHRVDHTITLKLPQSIDFIPVNITIEGNCCSKPENHKKTPLFSSIITTCGVCNGKIEA